MSIDHGKPIDHGKSIDHRRTHGFVRPRIFLRRQKRRHYAQLKVTVHAFTPTGHVYTPILQFLGNE